MYYHFIYSQHMISDQVYNRILQGGYTILMYSVDRSIERAEGCEEDIGLYFEYLNLLISKGAEIDAADYVCISLSGSFLYIHGCPSSHMNIYMCV